MKVSGTHTFEAPRERVWRFLIDPEQLTKCIPGCENLQTLAPNEYAGEITVGIGAVKGKYKGKVKLDEMREPEHYKMLIEAKGSQGFVKGSGTMDLAADGPGKTLLKYAGDAQIGGPLASVGQRMIDMAQKTMLAQFFTAMEAEIAAAPGEVVRQGVAINSWRLFLKTVREFFARLFGKKSEA